jgi:uncharacterized protein (TIGR03437 family)
MRGLLGLAFLAVSPALAAITSLNCVITAVPTTVRLEGLSERLGDINLTCTGAPGGEVQGVLNIFLGANVTNKLTSGGTLDVVVTVDLGAGFVSAGATARPLTLSSLVIENIAFTLPADGRVQLRISNLRIAAGQQGAVRPIQAFLATSGTSAILVQNNSPTIGIAQRSLYLGTSSTSIVCTGAALPADTSFSGLVLGGARFFTARITEGLSDAFETRQPMTDTGVRVILRYSGFPAGARLFVPDVVAGSNAVEPTSAGDFGLAGAGGKHAPGGDGSLLLSRVRDAAPDGSGGTIVYPPPPPNTGTYVFNTTAEVELINGSGYAVYEVVDSSRFALEIAQIPTFAGILPTDQPAIGRLRVTFAPLSTVAEPSVTAPVPRFADLTPPPDCSAVGDCAASYYPKLATDNPDLNFSLTVDTPFHNRYLDIKNIGGGVLNWTATLKYRSGAGWVRLSPNSAAGPVYMRIDVTPNGMGVGRYEADLIIDAGPIAGMSTHLIAMELRAGPAPQPPPPPPRRAPSVAGVANGATLLAGLLVPGSIAVIRGADFADDNVSVTLDGFPARVLSSSATAIRILVPVEVAGRASAILIVTAGGVASPPSVETLAAASPGIFPGAVLNQDYSVNDAGNPALVGTVLQVFATGLPLSAMGRIVAQIHDRVIDPPPYGGPAPGLDGYQQVNVPIPGDLPAMTTEVLVCGIGLDGRKGCSAAVPVTIRR